MNIQNTLRVNHLNSIGLWNEPEKQSVLEIIDNINYIQIDAIQIIARSQDIVAHTRSSSYNEREIWKEIENGNLFEGWAHAKCILPLEHFKYYHSVNIDRRGDKTWWQSFLDKVPDWPKQILEMVENHYQAGIFQYQIISLETLLGILQINGYLIIWREEDTCLLKELRTSKQNLI